MSDKRAQPAVRRTVQKRSIDRQKAMTDAAARLLFEDGIGAITHRRVAVAAGLPEGSATYYYPTQSALLAAAVSAAEDLRAERATAQADALVSRTRTASTTAKLLIEVYLAPAVGDYDVVRRLDSMFTAMRDPDLAGLMARKRPSILRALGKVLRSSGFSHVDDAALIAHLVEAALLSAVSGGGPSILLAARATLARLLERWPHA
jgi:DNA-binding transcriptional regulator YbjK